MLNSAGAPQRALLQEAPTALSRQHGLWGRVQPRTSVRVHTKELLVPRARGSVVGHALPYRQPPNQPQQPLALARRPLYEPVQVQQPVYLNLSELTDKPAITCVSGRNLGTIGDAWVDPNSLEVVGFELESKRGVTTTVTGTVALWSLKQIGDVVLVQEPNNQQQLDPRRVYIKLTGMEVRTGSNRVIGKVRSLAFNPDNGAVNRVEFDDFGLRFLKIDLFDTFSVPVSMIASVGDGFLKLKTDEVRAWPERRGFVSDLLRNLARRDAVAAQPQLADGRRGEVAVRGALSPGPEYEAWQGQIRDWEARTGQSYAEYMAQREREQQMQQMQEQQQQQQYGGAYNAGPPAALPAGRQAGFAAAAGPSAAAPYALPQPGNGWATRGPQPQPQASQTAPVYSSPVQQQQQQYGTAPGGYGGGDPRLRAPGPAPTATNGAAGRPLYTGAGAPPQQQQQAPSPQQPQAPQQQPQQPPQQQPQVPQQQWRQHSPPQQQPQAQQQPGWPAAGAGQQQPQVQRQPGRGPPRAGAPPQGGPPQPPLQQQAGGPYARPAAAGAGPEPSTAANGGGGGAIRVDEWLAREGQGGGPAMELVSGRQQQQPQLDANGWEAPGGGGAGGGARQSY